MSTLPRGVAPAVPPEAPLPRRMAPPTPPPPPLPRRSAPPEPIASAPAAGDPTPATPVMSERVDAPVEAVEVETVVPPEPIAAPEVTVEPAQPEPELVVASPAKAVSSKKKG